MIERFESKVSKEPMSGCWLWLGALSIGSYGKFYADREYVYAHRYAFEQERGPVPEGMVLDHMCRVRCCVNPWHLRVVTQRVNTLENSYSPSAKHALKERCGVCGGEYRQRRDRNARSCRDCDKKRCLDYRQRNLERLRAYDRTRPARPRRRLDV